MKPRIFSVVIQFEALLLEPADAQHRGEQVTHMCVVEMHLARSSRVAFQHGEVALG